mmetsp:Transcript_10503/g.14833  ORF Transcript_10503/g.14833 Transcript_10503/m.14833 type:complete len:216 (-) Transcript_10503:225-872(-)
MNQQNQSMGIIPGQSALTNNAYHVHTSQTVTSYKSNPPASAFPNASQTGHYINTNKTQENRGNNSYNTAINNNFNSTKPTSLASNDITNSRSSTSNTQESSPGISSSVSPKIESKEKDDDPIVAKLRKSWRQLASCMVIASRAATNRRVASSTEESLQMIQKESNRVVKSHADLREIVSSIEGVIRGNEEEMRALRASYRSVPLAVGRKRKRRQI